jgi:hypothetical protein
MRSTNTRLAALAAMASTLLAMGGIPNIVSDARVVASDGSAVANPTGKAPAKAPGTAQERFLDSFWSRRTKAPRGKRVRHSVAQDRRLARKARNVKRSKR